MRARRDAEGFFNDCYEFGHSMSDLVGGNTSADFTCPRCGSHNCTVIESTEDHKEFSGGRAAAGFLTFGVTGALLAGGDQKYGHTKCACKDCGKVFELRK